MVNYQTKLLFSYCILTNCLDLECLTSDMQLENPIVGIRKGQLNLSVAKS
jgi:hypothetical protein